MIVLEFLYTAANINGTDKNQKLVNLIRSEYNTAIDSVMRVIFDNTIVFGVKKIEPVNNGKMNPYLDFAPAWSLIKNLIAHTHESNAARDAEIKEVLSNYNSIEQDIIINIIKKKPRLGFTQKLLNTVITTMGYDPIEQFKCMKAAKLKSEEEYKNYLKERTAVETKYDGERLIAFVDTKESTVVYKTREGLPSIMNNDAIDLELISFAKEYLKKAYSGTPDYTVVVDGEKDAGTFTQTMNSKKTGSDMAHVKYKIFFAMTQHEWSNEQCRTTLLDFRNNTNDILKDSFYESISVTECTITDTYEEANAVYSKVLDAGGEGCMLKRLSSTYEWKRSNQWIKWVPKISFDGMIVEILPGDPGSKYECSCGKVKIIGVNEAGETIETYVGSGFSDEERNDMFANPDKYIGTTEEVEARQYSIDSKTGVRSLRFPTHKRFRTDK